MAPPSKDDITVAALAAGFTLGFGFLTVWEAIKQTRRNRFPLRSAYIWMIWGEIISNAGIGLLGWLFLDGVIGVSLPLLFFLLFFWVFEIQLLFQIIINRIRIIAEHDQSVRRLKWGTAIFITMINIAVFCIWIPSHTVPPLNDTVVIINMYWDRTSKGMILLTDAALNWYFLHIVKIRLVKQHGLVKYAPLVGFNAKLMALSVAMDAVLICLMSLPNQVVYIQFHPVTYMVKLNIEMSMATLITRLARQNRSGDHNSYQLSNPTNDSQNDADLERNAANRTTTTSSSSRHGLRNHFFHFGSRPTVESSVSSCGATMVGGELIEGGVIRKTTGLERTVERSSDSSGTDLGGRSFQNVEDHAPLTSNPAPVFTTTRIDPSPYLPVSQQHASIGSRI